MKMLCCACLPILGKCQCETETATRRVNETERLLYVSHTKVTYGRRNAISACVNVPLNVACSHASRLHDMVAHKSDSIDGINSSLYIKPGAQKKKVTQKKTVRLLYSNGRVEKRDGRTWNRCTVHGGGWEGNSAFGKYVLKKKCSVVSGGRETESNKKKVLFPLAKTRNYVYYTIGRAHFTFYGRKMTRYKENQTHTHTHTAHETKALGGIVLAL